MEKKPQMQRIVDFCMRCDNEGDSEAIKIYANKNMLW